MSGSDPTLAGKSGPNALAHTTNGLGSIEFRVIKALADIGRSLNRAATVDEVVSAAEDWFERVVNASFVRIQIADDPDRQIARSGRSPDGDAPTAPKSLVDAASAVADGRKDVIAIAAGDGRAPATHIFATRLQVDVDTDPIGVLAVEMNLRGELDEPLLALFESVATLVAAGLERSFDSQRDRVVVDSLATKVIPEQLPRLPGVNLAAVYRGAQTRAGGDWYDAFSLPGGLVGLVIGDVVGHGPDAAAAMTTVRTATRAEAMHTSAPERIIAGVNAHLRHFEGTVDPLATEIVVAMDPSSGQFTYASGGHLSPLVVATDGGVRLLEGGRGLVLGTDFSAQYRAEEQRLGSGEVLLLYTDGLVERRGEELGIGIERLAGVAAELAGTNGDLAADLENLVDVMLEGSNRIDDVAVLAARRWNTRIGDTGRVSAVFPPDLGSVDGARSLVSEMLAAERWEGSAEDAALLTSELATNAVRHADTAYQVDASLLDGVLRVDVVDLDRKLPHIVDPAPDEPGGRGLLIVDRISNRWGFDTIVSGGKSVWFELEPSGR